MGKGSVVAKIIAFLIIAALVAGAVGIVLKYTNGGNESFKTFYVRYGSRDILSTDTKTQLKLEKGQWHYFEAKYPLDVGREEPREYSVTVVPNADADFSFTAGGRSYRWSGVADDLSEYFGVSKQADSFTLFIPSDMSLRKILEGVYAGKAVSLPAAEELKSEYLYTLSVSSYNGKITYDIDLAIGEDLQGNPDGNGGKGDGNGASDDKGKEESGNPPVFPS